MKKIKILQIITGLGTGGAEKVVFELCRHSLQTDFEISVFAFGIPDNLLYLFKDENIKVDFIYAKKNLFGFIKVLRHLLINIKKEKYDLIHAHLFHAMVFACLAKVRFPSIPICFTSHNTILGSTKFNSALRSLIVFIFRPLRGADIIFSESQKRSIYKKDSFVIHNGIDAKKYKLNLPKNVMFTFINIARFEDAKNHFGLIEIVKKINTSIPFQILLVGDGYLREPILKSIEQNNLCDKIHLLGLRKDIPELCNKSHAFVLPSLWEGMPIVLLEAGASGLPVISTPVGSIPTIINESNGYLATIDIFAQVMLHVMENYEEAAERGSILQKEIIANYDTSVMYQKHMQVYLPLIREK